MTEIEICNLALTRLGTRNTISALDEGSNEANALALTISSSRRAFLAAFPWRAAKKMAAPALSSTDDFFYYYAKPGDCLNILSLTDSSMQTVQEWGLSGNKIQTRSELDLVVYTADIDYSLWSPGMEEAFSYRLAAAICSALTADRQLLADMQTLYRQAVSQAMAVDANQGLQFVPTRDAEWLRARHGGA